MGPLTAARPNKLPTNISSLISSPEGAIYVGFGTTYALKHANQLTTLVTALNKLAQNTNKTILWQIKSEDLPQGITLENLQLSSSIHTTPWVNQNDLLGSGHIKAFVTHGGNNAVLEAGYHGVPIVAIPLAAGEQIDNGSRARDRGFGLVVEKSTLTMGDWRPLFNAVIDVLENPRYKNTAEEVGKLMHAEYSSVSPQQSAANWIEYALVMNGEVGANGSGDFLRNRVEPLLTWFARSSLDIYASIIGALLSICLALYLFVRGFIYVVLNLPILSVGKEKAA